MQTQLATSDLGQGWFATMYNDGSCTVRNPDKGQRIDLPSSSVELFRQLWAKAERAAEYSTAA